MKVEKKLTPKGITEIHIIVGNEDANILQSAVLQFAEHVAKTKQHNTRMRRLGMLLDKVIE